MSCIPDNLKEQMNQNMEMAQSMFADQEFKKAITHIEPDGERLSFSMLESDGLLEAEYSKSERRSIITYRLSYLKIYPARDEELTVYEFREQR